MRYRVLGDVDKIEFHLTECKRFTNELKNHKIFTSLRHPRRIREAFKRREHNPARYPYNEEYFNIQWREMIDRIATLDPFYLHVDMPEVRDAEVDLMSEYFGRELPKNWEVVETEHTYGTHDVPVEECPPVPQEYIDFYYETIKKLD